MPRDYVWQQIEGLLATARERVILVAPFIKKPVFEAALLAVPSDLSDIACYTRWSPAEVAAGVSDPEIFEVAVSHGANILLCHELHAKLYMVDDRCLVGSANLTGRATGRSNVSNVEILVEVAADHPEVRNAFAIIAKQSQPATAELASAVRAQAELIKKYQIALPVVGETTEKSWVPITRAPELLYDVYAGRILRTSESVLEGILFDLARLDLPLGFAKRDFAQAIVDRLYLLPGVAAIATNGRLHSSDLERALTDAGFCAVPEARDLATVVARWLMEFDEVHSESTAYELVRGRRL